MNDKQKMPSALVLITCDFLSRQDVMDELKRIIDLDYVYNLHGYYNMIVKVTSDTEDHLRSTIMNHVRLIPKINSTLTLMVISEKRKMGRMKDSIA